MHVDLVGESVDWLADQADLDDVAFGALCLPSVNPGAFVVVLGDLLFNVARWWLGGLPAERAREAAAPALGQFEGGGGGGIYIGGGALTVVLIVLLIVIIL